MKIAFFHNLPSGGAKRALYGFVSEFARKGHSMDLFIPSTADESFLDVRPLVGRVVTEPVRRSISGTIQSTVRYVLPVKYSLSDLEKAHYRLAEQINSGDYDVVFVEQDRFTMSPFVLRYLKKPHVYYCPQPSRLGEQLLHQLVAGMDGELSPTPLLKRAWRAYLSYRLPRIDRQNAACAQYILTNSFFSHEMILKAYGLNSFVSYLGVDVSLFRKRDLPVKRYLLTVGSIEPTKGYDFLIRSIGRMDPKDRLPLVIIANSGNPSFQKYLEKLARRFDVEIEIRSSVTDEELVRSYNEASLFVYAPYLEPFGLAALEAMASGQCVVAVKEGGIRESVIDGETGFLVERDETAFAEKIVSLLKDTQGKSAVGVRAADWVRQFWTLEHAAERLLKHLRRVIGSGEE